MTKKQSNTSDPAVGSTRLLAAVELLKENRGRSAFQTDIQTSLALAQSRHPILPVFPQTTKCLMEFVCNHFVFGILFFPLLLKDSKARDY